MKSISDISFAKACDNKNYNYSCNMFSKHQVFLGKNLNVEPIRDVEKNHLPAYRLRINSEVKSDIVIFLPVPNCSPITVH